MKIKKKTHRLVNHFKPNLLLVKAYKPNFKNHTDDPKTIKKVTNNKLINKKTKKQKQKQKTT